ncbi:MAG: acetate--CoA ligase [bacterium]|nr:acetate--CoA ligase [bacterium]
MNEKSRVFHELWRQSIEQPSEFWLERANEIAWMRKPTQGLEYAWKTEARDIHHTWFTDGELNVSVSCLDRHLATKTADKYALIYQGEDEASVRFLTYRQLHQAVCRMANVLGRLGVKKGDRVGIYLPTVPEAIVSMLACARIGAVHSVMFGGLSAEAIQNRIQDADCSLIITADGTKRKGKWIPLKKTVDEALYFCPAVQTVVVVKLGELEVEWMDGRDHWYHDLMKEASPVHEPVRMAAEDPLFILYTSGSTGKPKGLVHTTGGYLLQAAVSHKTIFDLKENDVYWCTGDVGWITGHTYVVYGPLANGATVVLYDGGPVTPDPARYWQICDKFGVTIFYTSPTALRSLISYGDEWPARASLGALRILGSVGEPLNPEVARWYSRVIGKGRCPVVDTWWQTETGGIMIASVANIHEGKPGSAGRAFFGADPVVVRTDGTPADRNEQGILCLQKPVPGMARTLWRNHEKFIDTYFTAFPDKYMTGDGCRVDDDGDHWFTGRVDDVMNVSGHRLGSAELESALVSFPGVSEAAVVAVNDPIKGQAPYAFVALAKDMPVSEALREALVLHVRKSIGGYAVPAYVQFVSDLPKTRSGKIMRRILRKIVEKDMDAIGDMSTLADPEIVGLIAQETNEILANLQATR